MLAFKLVILVPCEPLTSLKLQLVNLAVPSVDVIIKGMLMIKVFELKVPKKSKVSPAFNFPEIMFPLPLK